MTGDSHLGALRRAMLQWQVTPGDVDLTGVDIRALGRGHLLRSRVFEARADHAEIIDSEYRQRVARVPPAGPAFDLIGMSGPLNTARVWRHEDFARLAPYPMRGSRPLISSGVLRALVEDDVRQSLEFIKVVKRNVPVFVVDAPWPFGRHPAVELAGRDTVQYIHRWYRAYVIAELDAMDVPVVEIDPACVDAQGFMNKKFRNENGRDLYHANASFGEVMWRQIMRRFDRRRLSPRQAPAHLVQPLPEQSPN